MLRRLLAIIFQGFASIHLTIFEESFWSIFICHPADLMLSMVIRLMLAPIILTTKGLSRSKRNPSTGLAGRMCLSKISLPSGLHIIKRHSKFAGLEFHKADSNDPRFQKLNPIFYCSKKSERHVGAMWPHVLVFLSLFMGRATDCRHMVRYSHSPTLSIWR